MSWILPGSSSCLSVVTRSAGRSAKLQEFPFPRIGSLAAPAGFSSSWNDDFHSFCNPNILPQGLLVNIQCRGQLPEVLIPEDAVPDAGDIAKKSLSTSSFFSGIKNIIIFLRLSSLKSNSGLCAPRNCSIPSLPFLLISDAGPLQVEERQTMLPAHIPETGAASSWRLQPGAVASKHTTTLLA